MTLAEAHRQGVMAASLKARDMAARLRAFDPVRLEVLANAATLETLADSLERDPPPFNKLPLASNEV